MARSFLGLADVLSPGRDIGDTAEAGCPAAVAGGADRAAKPARSAVRRSGSSSRVPKMAVLGPILLAGAISASPAGGVPVVPNESLVVGEVVELRAIDSSSLNIRPPQILFRMRIRVLSVREVPSKPNLVTTRKGEILEVYSKDRLSSDLIGKVIRGRVTFRGDERGGLHWIFSLKEASSD